MDRDYDDVNRTSSTRDTESAWDRTKDKVEEGYDRVTGAAERGWDRSRNAVDRGSDSTLSDDSTLRDEDRGGDWDRSEKRFRRVLSASTLAGDRVRNSAGEDLGKIEDLMIDVQDGRVAYAVLSFGGFLGIGDKLFAVPWNALTVNEQEKVFVLDVDRQTLENAPGFDKDNWPDMADPSWGQQIHGHYGQKPYWAGSEADDRSDVTSTDRDLLDRDVLDRDRSETFRNRS
jgi:sporulation protein YlmC with PRC-barrel domain